MLIVQKLMHPTLAHAGMHMYACNLLKIHAINNGMYLYGIIEFHTREYMNDDDALTLMHLVNNVTCKLNV